MCFGNEPERVMPGRNCGVFFTASSQDAATANGKLHHVPAHLQAAPGPAKIQNHLPCAAPSVLAAERWFLSPIRVGWVHKWNTGAGTHLLPLFTLSGLWDAHLGGSLITLFYKTCKSHPDETREGMDSVAAGWWDLTYLLPGSGSSIIKSLKINK